jgi:hypothetical protein
VIKQLIAKPTPSLAVTAASTPARLQRMCKCGSKAGGGSSCDKCGKDDDRKVLQRKASSDRDVGEVPPIVYDVLRSPGQPLDAETRAFFEPRFGHDFSRVRVHTNRQAADSALSISARAYTVGRDIAFGKGEYVPTTFEGKRLLAHELTHVVQQDSSFSLSDSIAFSSGSSVAEAQAEANASIVLEASYTSRVQGSQPTTATSLQMARNPGCDKGEQAECQPYSYQAIAEAAHSYLTTVWLPLSGFAGSEVQSIWETYLNKALGSPRPSKTFDAPGSAVVQGFINHETTALAEKMIVTKALDRLRTRPLDIPVGVATEVPTTELVSPGDIWQLLNSGGDAEMCFGGTFSIPGNIAGGVGVGQDSRNAWGTFYVTKYETHKPVDRARGTTASESTGIRYTILPKLTFYVDDVVDFCPGNSGGYLAKPITQPMSNLEATGDKFGPVYAADVPFRVIFPGPGLYVRGVDSNE